MRADEVTIVVLNWKRKDDTMACLASLERADLGGAAVLVVDNGSRDGSVEAIRARFPRIRLIELAENCGYAGGNNAGIRAALDAGARGVLLLNNDTEVSPDFLPPLLWALDAHPRAGAVCSAIHRMDRPEVLDVAYAEVHFGERHAVRLQGVNALPGLGFGTRREVQVAVGCSLLLTAEALREVGLFDERYFAYHEDVDWCLRARKAGYHIFYEPYSRVFHWGSVSTRRRGQTPRPGVPIAAESAPQPAMFLVTSRAAMLALDARPGTVVIRRDETKAYILQGDDPSVLENWTEYLDDLPNAEPMPWNPVSTYLGARNLPRLLRSHATREQKRAFVRSCLYELPLEFLAIVLGREGWMRLGRWSYRDAARLHFVERHAALRGGQRAVPERLVRIAALAVFVPIDLFWTLPREIWRAHREGRTAQFVYHLRGLWDGLLDRPIPLARLGLR